MSSDVDDDHESSQLVRFENYHEYVAKQDAFLTYVLHDDVDEARRILPKLEDQIQTYQEQAYLLDPYLERLVLPPARVLREMIIENEGQSSAREPYDDASTKDASMYPVARLLYVYTKVRGYKLISRFLPHKVQDIVPLLHQLECMHASRPPWELIYVTLLWLSLVVLVPFPLHRGTGASILERVERVTRLYVSRSGKERDAASIVLGRLYRRRDTPSVLFTSFLTWSEQQLTETARMSPFLATGTLQTLCEILKNADAPLVQEHYDAIRHVLATFRTLEQGRNGLVIRYIVKLEGRLALHLLSTAIKMRAGVIDANLETHIDTLMQALAYSDSRVRYSAAKGLARISACLPAALRQQIVVALLDMLAEHILPDTMPSAALSSDETFDFQTCEKLRETDLHAVSECTWHGVCLALAEHVRRTCVPSNMYVRVIYWVLTALAFDVRRATGSTGTSVRDASCYVLWSLARARDASSTLGPLAPAIAQYLVVSITLDREVSIRRASSAAFQEWVGRTSCIPHGIDILRKTDFAAVGPLRHAYLDCAPYIATWPVYRGVLLQHLMRVSLTHWDAAIRVLGAEAIGKIVSMDKSAASSIMQHLMARVQKTKDHTLVHGALLALVSLARVDSVLAPEASRAALEVSASMLSLSTQSAAAVLEAACRLVALAALPLQVQHVSDAYRGNVSKLLHMALARPEIAVQDAAVDAIEAWKDDEQVAHAYVRRALDTWTTLNDDMQRAAAKVMGVVPVHPEEQSALLCACLDRQAPFSSKLRVETRCAAAASLARLCVQPTEVVRVLQQGLHDMTTDQRGDVGSWVRLACMDSLGHVFCDWDVDVPALESAWVDMVGMLMERIDAVRVKAGHIVRRVADIHATALPNGESILAVVAEPEELRNAPYAFSVLVPLMSLERYRASLLYTLSRTIGSRSEMALREAGQALVDWALTVPDECVHDILVLLHHRAQSHARENRVFVPILQTILLLLDWDVHKRKSEDVNRMYVTRARVEGREGVDFWIPGGLLT